MSAETYAHFQNMEIEKDEDDTSYIDACRGQWLQIATDKATKLKEAQDRAVEEARIKAKENKRLRRRVYNELYAELSPFNNLPLNTGSRLQIDSSQATTHTIFIKIQPLMQGDAQTFLEIVVKPDCQITFKYVTSDIVNTFDSVHDVMEYFVDQIYRDLRVT